MGNITSRQLDIHRFLGLAVCHSTTIDPRRLEHHTYTYWTGDIAALLVRGQPLKHCLIAPQFPIYVSPKERHDPNRTGGSDETTADGGAEGVYVDIAIAMPLLEPRYVDELGTLGGTLENTNLHDFLENILPRKLPGLSPRCLWVSGFEAPLLAELKPGPTRHADRIHSFYLNLEVLLGQAREQAEEQALCLFCSWRFASQDDVILLAGAGDYYEVRRATREWAKRRMNNKPYTTKTLQNLRKAKAQWRERGDVDIVSPDDDSVEEDLNAIKDGDWTEGQMDEMYGTPEDAKERQARLNAERTQRRIKREVRRQQYMTALTMRPTDDRTAPLFTNEELNAIHPGGNFFESGPPELFFGKTSSVRWSGVLQLGSDMSNKYMAWIQDFIRKHEVAEEKRRRNVSFTKAPKQKA
ncbi:hypothetical protein MVEN_01226200 [Mycena venus]|uniref:Uncharacterized protein n=1 Tax=Mycena venus TaxID=2733690 RepID=A0A8H6Y4P3_9AGAR|nr:hypothetical protein MVEN_01226200 [Mycena venus]